MSRCPHTRFVTGKRVRVVLTDGSVHEDHYVSRTNGGVITLRSLGRVPAGRIKSISIARGMIRN